MLFEGAAPRRWIAHARSAAVEVTSTLSPVKSRFANRRDFAGKAAGAPLGQDPGPRAAELLAEIAERGERHGERGSRAATKLSDLGVSKGRSRRRGRLSEDQNRSDFSEAEYLMRRPPHPPQPATLPVWRTLEKIGIPHATFYRWYDVRERIVQLALDEPALSPRQLAVRFTDTPF